jgi:hypothetical protein
MATKAKTSRRDARTSTRKWSARVTQTSDALTLEEGVFKHRDPRAIARSLKRSADASRRRKGTSFQSAMSMLTFYINRAGSSLGTADRRRLEQAKSALRDLYGRSSEWGRVANRKSTKRKAGKRKVTNARM